MSPLSCRIFVESDIGLNYDKDLLRTSNEPFINGSSNHCFLAYPNLNNEKNMQLDCMPTN